MKKIYFLAAFCMALFSCSSGGGGTDPDVPDQPQPDKPTTEKLPINISTTITRATETTFETGDKVGLFIVNHNADGTPANLKPSGNYVDNMPYTYNAAWIPAEPVYWKDETTHADFYLYYPYRANLTSIRPMAFHTSADQSNVTDYKASDFITGSTLDVAPTTSTVSIMAKHLLSQVDIILKAGPGFTDATLAASNVSVRLNGLKPNAMIDLASAVVSATGVATTITPYKDGDVYRAIVVPQEVAQANLITVNVNGQDYNLSKAFNFVSGKRHTFTVTLDKSSSGLNVTIGAWEDDGSDNGGTAN